MAILPRRARILIAAVGVGYLVGFASAVTAMHLNLSALAQVVVIRTAAMPGPGMGRWIDAMTILLAIVWLSGSVGVIRAARTTSLPSQASR